MADRNKEVASHPKRVWLFQTGLPVEYVKLDLIEKLISDICGDSDFLTEALLRRSNGR